MTPCEKCSSRHDKNIECIDHIVSETFIHRHPDQKLLQILAQEIVRLREVINTVHHHVSDFTIEDVVRAMIESCETRIEERLQKTNKEFDIINNSRIKDLEKMIMKIKEDLGLSED